MVLESLIHALNKRLKGKTEKPLENGEVFTGLIHLKQTRNDAKPCRTFTTTSSLAFIFGILGTVCMLFSFDNFLMNEWLNMRPGLPKYNQWLEPAPEITLKVYVWNYTNTERFLRGEDDKLHLQEIGPITYIEVQRHKDVEFHENSTLSFTATKEIFFAEDRNIPGILNQTIIVPNLVTLGITSYLVDAGFFVNYGAKMMINHENEGPFRSMSIYDFLWNYRSEVLNLAKTLTGSLVIPVDNVGILEHIYSNFSHRLNVKIGPDNGHEKFFFLNSYDHRTTVPGYQLEKRDCNASILDATEGIFYPQKLTKHSVLKYWRKTICMPAKLYYEKQVQRGLLWGYKYILPDSVFDRTEEDCYKGSDLDHSMPDGLADVSKCYFGMSFVISKPHFLGRMGPWTEKLQGLQPQRDVHDSFIIAEPKMGVPLEQSARSMANFYVSEKLSPIYSEDFQKLKGMVLPIFWLEIRLPELTQPIKFLLYLAVNVVPLIDACMGPALLLTSLLLAAYSLKVKIHSNKAKVAMQRY